MSSTTKQLCPDAVDLRLDHNHADAWMLVELGLSGVVGRQGLPRVSGLACERPALSGLRHAA